MAPKRTVAHACVTLFLIWRVLSLEHGESHKLYSFYCKSSIAPISIVLDQITSKFLIDRLAISLRSAPEVCSCNTPCACLVRNAAISKSKHIRATVMDRRKLREELGSEIRRKRASARCTYLSDLASSFRNQNN
jgi:hypothetical protein